MIFILFAWRVKPSLIIHLPNRRLFLSRQGCLNSAWEVFACCTFRYPWMVHYGKASESVRENETIFVEFYGKLKTFSFRQPWRSKGKNGIKFLDLFDWTSWEKKPCMFALWWSMWHLWFVLIKLLPEISKSINFFLSLSKWRKTNGVKTLWVIQLTPCRKC